jgi:hypothetical protein
MEKRKRVDMNIYQKLIKARIELQELKLKKSGKNTYSNYSYYELGDFLPAVNKLCQKYDILTRFNIVTNKASESAVLTLYNAPEPTEKISFTAPTAEVNIGAKWKDGKQIGGADPIQNLGGKLTYLRRYMLLTAFEIAESDFVEHINRQLSSELPDEEIKKIEQAKDKKELLKVCGNIKNLYDFKLITPHYEKRLTELTQDEE